MYAPMKVYVCVCVCSYLLWINGPSNETSVMLLDLDTKEKSTTYVSTIYNILDLSIDLFDNRIFLLTEEGALLSLRFSGLVTELFRFKGDKPIALDILGFHSYVLLADGNLVQINNQRPSECEWIKLITYDLVVN